MSKKIHVITVHHHWAYRELASSITDALKLYGFDVHQSDYFLDQSDFNIFISGQHQEVDRNNINIVYETDHAFKSPTIRLLDYTKYTRSLHWFDYTQDLTDQNIYYCPIGYSKHFDTHLSKRDLRPNFHMGRTEVNGPRDLLRKKYNLFTVNDPHRIEIIGKERDELIVTSKVNINSKFHEDYAFASMHAALILCKGKMLLQEDYGLDDYNWYKPYLVLFTDDNFLEKLEYWTTHDKERHEFEAFIYEDIKANHKFEDIFYAAIGDLLEEYR